MPREEVGVAPRSPQRGPMWTVVLCGGARTLEEQPTACVHNMTYFVCMRVGLCSPILCENSSIPALQQRRPFYKSIFSRGQHGIRLHTIIQELLCSMLTSALHECMCHIPSPLGLAASALPMPCLNTRPTTIGVQGDHGTQHSRHGPKPECLRHERGSYQSRITSTIDLIRA